MKGNLLLLLLLLLATGVAQTDNKPVTDQAAGAEKTKVKTEAVKGQKKEAQPKPKAAQEGTKQTQADAKKAQGEAETAQPKTDAAQPKTEAAQANTEEPQAQTDQEPKLTSVPGGKALGMSVLGNQETPTSLVIVPWKSSEVGRATGISPMLDDSRQPVDKEVFMRELRYYEIRSEKK
jgi:hypothetical protein